jgi:hypothetical protein
MERETRKMTRREIVEKLLAGMAAGAVLPAISSSHPLHRLVRDGTALEHAESAQTAVDWKPLFLNTPQNEMLVTLAESIVPGSAKAKVNRFIDLLLSVDTSENRGRFVVSLTSIESSAQTKFGRRFHQLTASEKDELLTRLSTEKTDERHFDDLKEWVTVAYYSSEEGMRELGWSGNRTFRTFPGCEHESESH